MVKLAEIFLYVCMGVLAVGVLYQMFGGKKKCDRCGGKLEETGNNFTYDSLLFGGFDTFYKCTKCGKIHKEHHYTYD